MYGLDQFGVFRIDFDLSPEPAHRHVYAMVVGLPVGVIELVKLLEKFLPREHAPRIPNEDLEKVGQTGKQPDESAVGHLHLALYRIETPPRERVCPAGFGRGLQQIADAQQQLARVRRFAHEVVGASFERGVSVVLAREPGTDDDQVGFA